MTPHTDADQERTEFLEQVGHLIMDGTIETRSTKRAGISFACGNLHAAFMVWKAARRAPAAPVPQGWKLVPVELLERIQESLGSFVSDQGWSQSDMDTADALGGLLAAAPQPPANEI